MARRGESLEHPVTGERLTFLETRADTNGDLLRLDFWMRPGGFVAAEHLHPHQEERFVVRAGTGRFRIARSQREVGAGETAVVPPGVRHVWWNGGDDELHAEVEFRPALRVEEFFEVFFGLAAAGRANRRGLPNPLWLAAIGKEFSQEVRLARVPYPLLKIATEPVALLARAVGYRASPEFVSALGR